MGFAGGQVSQSAMRAEFAHQMSLMYSNEVPLYKTLVDIVSDINREELKDHKESDSVERISAERHGAIRLATYSELQIIARLFSVMGMFAVGYYDLSVKNLPVHSTAFRPIDRSELAQNPFRMFCSVLRMDLLDEKVAEIAKRYLGGRTIFSDRLMELIECYEADGFNASQAEAFVSEAVIVFKWHDEAVVSREEYQELLSVNGLIADIIGFKGPHINHLTPRVLDIDHLHERMKSLGHTMIPNIQGPPRRKHDILLRQTSFQALNEHTRFPDGKGRYEEGHHRARFGEIEQRGLALTPKGRDLYDHLLHISEEEHKKHKDQSYQTVLERIFKKFPDEIEALRKQQLGYFHYEIIGAIESVKDALSDSDTLESLIDKGYIKATPITYEDFLPVSAAGIFQSNLVEGNHSSVEQPKTSCQREFEEGLGIKVNDPFAIYAAEEAQSIEVINETLGMQFHKIMPDES